ncbi:uncharacterized protein L969DRAFT_440665 [Mixia osmundae IAM 14324]|uniref:uncharacterized protein n=1 Tax=Mixia osmundae (strain CBS 9802 / IAM 14324 / JCM 22182 / KY 12970) TaxID=764103 RepID=UPI0004A54AC0|nr:uncharacterized protein L969DRAFT_440665 [Mixia osmundae IAM 14324]KEI39336.1 hypothetical protein L969DRAFT_440665 [Mixia osmundae IAM 14324]
MDDQTRLASLKRSPSMSAFKLTSSLLSRRLQARSDPGTASAQADGTPSSAVTLAGGGSLSKINDFILALPLSLSNRLRAASEDAKRCSDALVPSYVVPPASSRAAPKSAQSVTHTHYESHQPSITFSKAYNDVSPTISPKRDHSTSIVNSLGSPLDGLEDSPCSILFSPERRFKHDESPTSTFDSSLKKPVRHDRGMDIGDAIEAEYPFPRLDMSETDPEQQSLCTALQKKPTLYMSCRLPNAQATDDVATSLTALWGRSRPVVQNSFEAAAQAKLQHQRMQSETAWMHRRQDSSGLRSDYNARPHDMAFHSLQTFLNHSLAGSGGTLSDTARAAMPCNLSLAQATKMNATMGGGAISSYGLPPLEDAESVYSSPDRSSQGVEQHSKGGSMLTLSESPFTMHSFAGRGNIVGDADQVGHFVEAGSYFATATTDKVCEMIDNVLTLPVIAQAEDCIVRKPHYQIVEYGSARTSSWGLASFVVQKINKALDKNDQPSYSVVHADCSREALISTAQRVCSANDSYLSPAWLHSQVPNLTGRIFQSFVTSEWGTTVVPESSVHVGLSILDLEWSHTNHYCSQPATRAFNELTGFLELRATEFIKDGMLFVCFVQRSDLPPASVARPGDVRRCTEPHTHEDSLMVPSLNSGGRRRSGSSPPPATTAVCTEPQVDIWRALTSTLTPCVQRLVSTGQIKPDTARNLLAVPIYPRSPRQTIAALKAVSNLWQLEASCLTHESHADSLEAVASEPSKKYQTDCLYLLHPACAAVRSGALDSSVYAEHALSFVKRLYDRHFRQTLRRTGMSRNSVEWTLQLLYDTLREKIEEGGLARLELEIAVLALRRR